VRLVVRPVRQLHQAAKRVSEGDLNARVDLLRADELGMLIERFNHMVDGLREREQLHETFGRHVGREAAKQILIAGDDLSGREQDITVMFVDVRDFTTQSSLQSPEQVVLGLNIFFRAAVDTIESHGGMVNKYLGDGFMALFGVGPESEQHAQRAVQAGIALLRIVPRLAVELGEVGWPALRIGIGINTGRAVVGSIGSPKRQEYTAIGDAINVASRVESLTKSLGYPLVITEATQQRLDDQISLISLPPQLVKGKTEPIVLYAVDCDATPKLDRFSPGLCSGHTG
jgi:adenylate cyclase